MEFNAFVYNFLNPHTTTPSEKIHAKANIFCIDNTVKINKLAFAYFLDRYQTANNDEKQEIDSLIKHQWFAGSLTAEQFALSLESFLKASESSNLHPEFKQHIQKFISNLQKSADQGYLIDLIRSRDLRLIFLILTGRPIGGEAKPTPQEIGEVTQETLKQLQEMNVGDKRIFLVGSLFHETRMTVEKKEKGWEFCYYDSNSNDYKIYESSGHDSILLPNFWEKIYALKFNNNISELEPLLKKEFIKISERNVYSMKKQEKNTCHFKSLLGVLKTECFTFSQNADENLAAWRAFKLAYGEFLLKNEDLSPEIKIQASKQQTKRSAKQEQEMRFLDIIQHAQVEDTIKVYQNALKYLGMPMGTLPNYSSLKMLNYLDHLLQEHLKSNSVHFEAGETLLRDLNHPCINHTLNVFKISFEKERHRIETELGQELKMANSSFDGFLEDILDKVKKRDTDLAINEVLKYQPLKKEKVLEWLAAFAKNPQLLSHLSRRPYFVCLMIHGIYLGEVDKVEKLYRLLNSDDKELLYQGLKKSKENAYFSPQSIPESVLDIYEGLSDHPLKDLILEMLTRKALESSSLIEMCRLEQIQPGILFEVILIHGYTPLNSSKEQIEEFFAWVKLQDLDELDSDQFQKLCFDLFKHIIKSGWFDQFDKAPPQFLERLIQAVEEHDSTNIVDPGSFLPEGGVIKPYKHIELDNTKQLNCLETFASQNFVLKDVLHETIILHQYKFKYFNKLIENDSLIFNSRIYSNYRVLSISSEEIHPFLEVFLKAKSRNLEFFIINNLVAVCKKFSDRKMLATSFQFFAEHKPDALDDWLNEWDGVTRLDRNESLFALKSIIEQKDSFEDTFVSELLHINERLYPSNEIVKNAKLALTKEKT